MAPRIRRRVSAICGGLVLVATACTQAANRPSASGIPTSVPSGPATTGSITASSFAPVPPGCTEASAIASWPLGRRAAQLIVIPALNGGVLAVTKAIELGVGGVVLLGDTPPSNLASQIGTVDRRVAVKLLVMVDEEGGGVQRLAPLVGPLPWPRQMAATMTSAQVEAAVAAVARHLHALGVGLDLAPVVDVDGGTGPSTANPDGLRSFGANPATVARYSAAFIRGLRQGQVLAAAKHFPGLGGASANTDYGAAATLPLSTLQSAALPSFGAAIGAGAAGVMMSNASVPGLTTGPATMSSAAVKLLRGELGFSGLVITDSLSAGAITASHVTVAQAAVAAVEAGSDMVLFGSTLTAPDLALLSPAGVASSTTAIVSAVVGAVESGQLPESALNRAVLRVLTAKGVVCPS